MRDDGAPLPPADYNRPSQPWNCGNADDGVPCPFGPLRGGRCAHLSECRPTKSIAGTWQCERAAVRGGTCEPGPNEDGTCGCTHSCAPRPSLRTTRGRTLRVAALLAVGILLMVVGSEWRQAALVPGPLSSHHAQVLRGTQWQSRCSACHSASDQQSTAWLAAAISGHQVGGTQTSLCMKCHDQTIEPQFATLAHSMAPAQLAFLANAASVSPAKPNDSTLACSTCHQEHHGADFNIALMNDARCQACHRESYDHFAGSHPDFGQWPYETRTAIAFDHAGHAAKHFAAANKSFDCRLCHAPSADGTTQTTLGFDQACASCHQKALQLAGEQGFAILSLPTLDVKLLADEGHAIRWPADADGDFDGQIPAATMLLLAGDAAMSPVIERLGFAIDLFDIDPDSPEDLAAVAALALGLERLASELAADFDGTIARRTEAIGGAQKGAEQSGGATATAAAEAAQAWFSNRKSTPAAAKTGEWSRDDTRLTVQYTPRGHADPVLKAWFELAVSLPEGPQRDAAITALAGPRSAGTCGTCHTVDRSADGTLAVQWHYRSPDSQEPTLTHFSHKPHTMQPELESCRHCHALQSQAVASLDLLQFDPHVFASDFTPLSKASCVGCHQPSGATSRCSTCHHYHVRGGDYGATPAMLLNKDTGKRAGD